MKLTIVQKGNTTEFHFHIVGVDVRWKPKEDEHANMWSNFLECVKNKGTMTITSANANREKYYIEFVCADDEVHATVYDEYDVCDDMYSEDCTEFLTTEEFLEATAKMYVNE